MEVSDLGNRIRAARAYAGDMSREELAAVLEQSVSWLRTVEAGRGIKPVEAAGLISRVEDVCGIPAEWFTSDWSQLDPDFSAAQGDVAELRAHLDQRLAEVERMISLLHQLVEAHGLHVNERTT